MTALDTLLPFDRRFGTCVAERSDLPCLCGWSKALATYYLRAIIATERR